MPGPLYHVLAHDHVRLDGLLQRAVCPREQGMRSRCVMDDALLEREFMPTDVSKDGGHAEIAAT
jgi:hypothetical protein